MDYHLNDSSVDKPESDKFRFGKLATQISTAIEKNVSDEGTVISIHGKWGSGKSSLINLIEYRLKNSKSRIQTKPIFISRFNCWWIQDEEALITEFFRQIYGTISGTSDKDKLELVVEVGSKILVNSTPILGAVSNLFLPGSAEFISKMSEAIRGSIMEDQNLHEMYSKLYHSLSLSKNRYLIIIDDIDRMFSSEVFLMFKLIKTVGLLPNFMYLLAYDREVVDKTIVCEAKSSGSNYLEKFVQVSFDVPKISQLTIKANLLESFYKFYKEPKYFDFKHFKLRLSKLVLPFINSPRNLKRVTNMINITWRTVEDELDFADFMAIETLRILKPNLYNSIWLSKDKLLSFDRKRKFEKLNLFSIQKINDACALLELSENDIIRFKNGLQEMLVAKKVGFFYSKISIFEYIFKKSENKQINNPVYFDQYFQFSQSSADETDFETELFKDNVNVEFLIQRIDLIIETCVAEYNSGELKKFLIEYYGICDELSPLTNKVILKILLSNYSKFCKVYSVDNQFEEFEPELLIRQFLPIFQKIELDVPDNSEKVKQTDLKIDSILKCVKDENFEFLADFALLIFRILHSNELDLDIPSNMSFSAKDTEKLFEKVVLNVNKHLANFERLKPRIFRCLLLFWDKFVGEKNYSLAKKFFQENIESDKFIIAILDAFYIKVLTLQDDSEVKTYTFEDGFDIDGINCFSNYSELETRARSILSQIDSNHEDFGVLYTFTHYYDEYI